MKPILTFVLGAALASAIAVFMLKRSPEPVVAVPGVPPVSETIPPAPTAAPEPEPAATGFARTPSKSTKAPQAAANQTHRSPAPAKEHTISSNAQTTAPSAGNTTSTAANPQGGPPQTTISMPPAPSGGNSTAESKPPVPVRVPKTVTIPSGTLLTVRVDETLSTKTNQTGDSFRATLDGPLVVDGAVVAEKGARLEGRVAEADAGGRVKGRATLALELVRLNTSDGQRLRIQTEGFSQSAEKSTKKDALKVGIGAGLGAAIGAIAGGGKGAAIGAGVGGAAGTGTVMATRGEAATVPAETRLSFRLREALTVTEKLK